MQTFIYMSNFAKGMKRCGEIWLSMAKDVYTESKRRMKTLTQTGETDVVELMQPTIDQETGEIVMANDLGAAAFDVNVDVGPSSSSKKAATVRALTGMLQITQDPETAQVLGAMAMMNMEGSSRQRRGQGRQGTGRYGRDNRQLGASEGSDPGDARQSGRVRAEHGDHQRRGHPKDDPRPGRVIYCQML